MLAKNGNSLNMPERLAAIFGAPGCRPNPILLRSQFSAAIEYIENVIRKMIQGANPRKNNRGVYVDWQLLMYLGMRDLRFLTSENFSKKY